MPFEYTQSLTTVVKMVDKSVVKKEEIWASIKAHSKIGCSLKQIFAEISVVYGSTNVSYFQQETSAKMKISNKE